MKFEYNSQESINNSDIKKISNLFLDEKVTVYPTDTIYGLGMIMTDQKSFNIIRKIKESKSNKPFIVLINNYYMLKNYFYVSEKQDRLLHDIWTPENRPTTVILKPRPSINKSLIHNNGVAVRMPLRSPFLIKLIDTINLPIISTSLNKSGEEPIVNPDTMNPQLINGIDLVVSVGNLRSKASRVIDIRNVNNIIIIRK